VERVLHADEDDPRQVEHGDDHRGDRGRRNDRSGASSRTTQSAATTFSTSGTASPAVPLATHWVGARIGVQSGDDDADWNSPATTP
jgi:hypothetical protein